MKPETKRRVKNLLKILSKCADVESNGEYQIVTYTYPSRPIVIRGMVNYMFDMIPHYKFGKVLMP